MRRRARSREAGAFNVRQTRLKRTKRGFVRSIGPADGAKKFYLGHDQKAAEAKLEQLLALWTLFEERQLRKGQPPHWTPEMFEAAKAIAAGDPLSPLRLEKGDYEPPSRYFKRVNESGKKLGIPVEPANQFLYEVGREDIEREIAHLQRGLSTAAPTGNVDTTGQTLFQALGAYREHIRHEYQTDVGITDNGKTKLDQLKSIETYVSDIDLGTSILQVATAS